MLVELYEHQQKAVDKMHNGCILRGDVGTGKTITSLYYYYTKVCKGVVGDQGSMRDPKHLIVITTAKKRDSLDWEEDAAMLGVFKNPDDNPSHISIAVDSWNNIGKYEEVVDAFFIFDEQRLVGAGAWTKSFIKIAKSNEWILLSATPGDTWLDYIPVFLANGFYKNRTEFKREHVVYNNYSKFPKVERYTSPGVLVRHRNSILVEMPYHRHTVRHEADIEVDFDTEVFKRVLEDRWHVYEERPLRDVAELFSVMRKVVNSDPSRLHAIQQLLAKHPRLIVFYNFNYELEMLRTLGGVFPEESGTAKSLSTSKPTSPKLSNSDSSPTTPSTSVSMRLSSGAKQHSLSSTSSGSASIANGSKTTSPKSSTSLESSSTDCPGHWTEDEGNGEFYLTCKDGVCWVPDEAREEGGSWEICGDTRFCETGDCLDGFMSVRDGKYSAREDAVWVPDGLFTEGGDPTGDWVINPKVLHVKDAGKTTDDTQVYVGRPSRWGNPFVIGKDGTRDEVIAKYRDYLLSSSLMLSIEELRGKNLVCFCSPEACHADVLLELANGDTKAALKGLSEATEADLSAPRLTVAEWNGHKHEQVPETDKWLYLVQYVAGAEGWNCVSTDAMAFWSLTYSYKILHQSKGRIDRLNTPFIDLWYYILKSNSMIDKAVAKSLVDKKSFNETDFGKKLLAKKALEENAIEDAVAFFMTEGVA